MKAFTLDHIHYKCQNFEQTKKFYVEVMGAIDNGYVDLGEPGKRSPNLQLEFAGVNLLFAEDSAASTEPTTECKFPCNVPPWKTRHGVYHIAILVDNCDKATAHFAKRAKEVYGMSKEIVAMGPFFAGDAIRASFLEAPDGMAIELKENLTRS